MSGHEFSGAKCKTIQCNVIRNILNLNFSLLSIRRIIRRINMVDSNLTLKMKRHAMLVAQVTHYLKDSVFIEMEQKYLIETGMFYYIILDGTGTRVQ